MTLTWSWLTGAVTLGLAVACAAAEDPELEGAAVSGGGVPGALAGGRSNVEETPAGGGRAGATAGSAAGGSPGRDPAPSASDGGDAENAIGGAYGVIGAGGDASPGEPTRPPAPDVCQTGGTAAPSTAGALLVRLKANSDQPTEFLNGEFQISNEGYSTVELAELELHYYFQSEYEPQHTDALLVTIDHAQKSGLVHTNIAQKIVHSDVRVLDPSATGANAYVVLAFSTLEGRDGTLSAGETVVVKFRMEPPTNSAFNYYGVPRDQTNDYSFGACPLHASAFSRVVLLRAGEVMSGEPPAGVVAPDDGSGGAGGMGSGGAQGIDAAGAGGSS